MKINENFIAVIIGGAQSFGLSTARQLISQKAKIIFADKNQQSKKIIVQNLGCQFFRTDVSNQQNVKQLFQYSLNKYGHVDAVINCEEIYDEKPFISQSGVLSTEYMLRILETNVIGAFNITKYAAKYMAEKSQQHDGENGEKGVIINLSNTTAYDGKKGQVMYAASKGAILGMTSPMASDLAKFKIRVVTIATQNFDKINQQNSFSQISKQNEIIGSRKKDYGTQFANCVKAIIQNPYVTGTTWRLNKNI